MNDSLIKVTKIAGMAFVGSLAGLFIAFLCRLLIARNGTEADYGVFSLAYGLLSILSVIATLGMMDGVARNIAYARGSNDTTKINKFILTSIQYGLLVSTLLCIILFFSANLIATGIFHDAALVFPLKVLAFAVPFSTMLGIMVSVFRGFDNIKPRVYFNDILRNSIFLIFLLPIFFLELSFTWVFYALFASFAVPCMIIIVYATKRLPSPVKLITKLSFDPITKELLFFSLPLLGVAILSSVLAWSDTLMLGFYKSSVAVGLYNVAYPLAAFISSPVFALRLIYIPVVSKLYAQNEMPEIKRNFSILTKWLCAATLPPFLILFLFPETVISFLFGDAYTPAINTLRILSAGFIINNILGLNGETLVAIGKTKFIMWATLATSTLNVVINVVLIPPLGIEGAAIALITAMTSINIIRCLKLYSISKVQPLSKNLLKSMFTSILLISILQYILGNFVTVVWWMLPLLLILYYALYGIAILITKSFDQEDITMLMMVEKNLGINLSIIKRIIRGFL